MIGAIEAPETNTEDTQETTEEQPTDQPDAEAKLPEGFELDEAQTEHMKQIQAIAAQNPDAVDFAFNHATNNGDLENTGFVKVMTEQLGVEQEEAENLIQTTAATYIAVTDAAVAEVSNVEPQLVYDWIRDKQPAMAAQVIQDAQAGRFGSVKEATGRYLSNLASIDPEAALGADLGPHAKAVMVNGKVAVRMNGKICGWSEAMRFRQ